VKLRNVYILCLALPSVTTLFSQQTPAPHYEQPSLPAYQENEQKIVWISGPARPGDSVIVTGAFTCSPKTVAIASLAASRRGDWRTITDKSAQTVKADSVNSESISFTLPDTLPQGPYGFRISDAGGMKLYGRINRPEIYWTMGLPPFTSLTAPDARITRAAVPKGGVLRIFGRNLGYTAEVVLTANNRHVPLPVISHDDWSIAAAVPLGLADGSYKLSVRAKSHNANTESDASDLKVYTFHPARPNVINVSSCGARGDGQTDDSQAIQNCLNQTFALGSGPNQTRAVGSVAPNPTLVKFDAKRYVITKPLLVPEHVYFLGDEHGKTTLYILPSSLAASGWITGYSYFGLLNLTIQANSERVLSNLSSTATDLGHILIDHVNIEVADTAGRRPDWPGTHDVQLRISSALSNGQKDTLQLQGDDIRILNTTVKSTGRALIMTKASAALLDSDAFLSGYVGWYNLQNCDGVIFQNSRISGTDPFASGGSYSAGPGISENIYTAFNSYEHLPGNNGEALTTDGPGGAYFGHLARVAATRFTLASDPNWKNSNWRGSSVAILGGRGAGQYRIITNASLRDVEIESPFDISPDESSLISIIPTQRHYIIVNNRAIDAGVGFQFYGTIFESVIAANTVSRSGGVFLHAGRYGDGIQPNFFVQVLDNRIVQRGSFKGGLDNPNIDDPGLVQVHCAPPSATLGVVVRGNDLSDQGQIRILNRSDTIHGLALQKNAAAGQDNAVQVQQKSDGVVIR
jgi:Pectate lyase superfamily protein